MTDPPTTVSPASYQLLDFGAGRKLERFGEYLLDRPCRTANPSPFNRTAWAGTHARYDTTGDGRGTWSKADDFPATWNWTTNSALLELKLTPAGQVGA
ncbi:MAG TPA: hypothetical protein VIY86_13655, partial [Pirellulaceae bacterium]